MAYEIILFLKLQRVKCEYIYSIGSADVLRFRILNAPDYPPTISVITVEGCTISCTLDMGSPPVGEYGGFRFVATIPTDPEGDNCANNGIKVTWASDVQQLTNLDPHSGVNGATCMPVFRFFAGTQHITATAKDSGGMTATAMITINVINVPQGSGTTVGPPRPAPTCLISTATYGSALAPEVQLLRNFRDNSLLKTAAGTNFMLAFNAWYYSFSPQVASYLNTHVVERTIMKGVLYPLIGIIYLTSNVFAITSNNPEVAALMSGLLASSLIGAFYLGLPLAMLRTRIRRFRGWRTQKSLQKILTATLLAALGSMLVGEVISSSPMLIISTSAIVLSTLFLSAIITSGAIAKQFTSRN
jgi:hypothetical protein